MNEPFNILVNYLGTEYELKARFEPWGYTHRIVALVGENTFVFEPDEEGGYRALADKLSTNTSTDAGLLQAVSDQLVKLSN
ncbi:hypothetical protein [Mucilaginibacter defluvii]|uniref:Uncharacterized protein n=1 Tax=Mucilaginibacter defluvii TaxID=1196019 RepID=A0ABP9FZU0_9SPHI